MRMDFSPTIPQGLGLSTFDRWHLRLVPSIKTYRDHFGIDVFLIQGYRLLNRGDLSSGSTNFWEKDESMKKNPSLRHTWMCIPVTKWVIATL
jgi:hypothetical protein